MEKPSSPSLYRCPSMESVDPINRHVMSWKDTLLDNLLLFAATPKGEQFKVFIKNFVIHMEY